jgi:hypothetical protein
MADLTGLPPSLRLVINQALVEIDNVSQQIEAGQIDVDEWQREMSAIIDRFYQEATEIGAEGADVSDLSSTVNRLVAVQLEFLNNFADEIRETGWIASSYPARADMYGSAIKQGYWYGDVIAQVGRVLPLPAMPSEGTQCLSNDKCHWRIVTIDAINGDYDAYWELSPVEHCQTCLERRAQWYPIQIRGGELVV